MRIGLKLQATPGMESLANYGLMLNEVLADDHDVEFFPFESAYFAHRDAVKMHDRFLANCDVVMAYAPADVLAARNRTGASVPIVIHLMGSLARGGHGWQSIAPLVTTSDLLVANCSADARLALRFFPNATVTIVPFGFDERVFYPLDAVERESLREQLG